MDRYSEGGGAVGWPVVSCENMSTLVARDRGGGLYCYFDLII